MPATTTDTFTDVQDTFFSYIRDIKYATMITVDRENRPRARVLLPVWEIVDGRPVGRLASYKTPVKAAHLAHSPYTTYVLEPPPEHRPRRRPLHLGRDRHRPAARLGPLPRGRSAGGGLRPGPLLAGRARGSGVSRDPDRPLTDPVGQGLGSAEHDLAAGRRLSSPTPKGPTSNGGALRGLFRGDGLAPTAGLDRGRRPAAPARRPVDRASSRRPAGPGRLLRGRIARPGAQGGPRRTLARRSGPLRLEAPPDRRPSRNPARRHAHRWRPARRHRAPAPARRRSVDPGTAGASPPQAPASVCRPGLRLRQVREPPTPTSPLGSACAKAR